MRSAPPPVAETVGLAQDAVAAHAELAVGGLRTGVVGEAVEIEALGAHSPERFVENEAQEGRAQPLSGARDGDALEVEVGVQSPRPRRMAKASIAPPAPIPSR